MLDPSYANRILLGKIRAQKLSPRNAIPLPLLRFFNLLTAEP